MPIQFTTEEFAAVLVEAVADVPPAGLSRPVPRLRARAILESYFRHAPRGETDLQDLWVELYGDIDVPLAPSRLLDDVLKVLGERPGDGSRLLVFERSEVGSPIAEGEPEAPSPAPPPEEPVEEEEDEEPRILSVQWVENDSNSARPAGDIQFVNVPAETKYLHEGEVRNVDQLGRAPKIKVRFNKEGAHSFEIKLVPGANNSVYTSAEKLNNPAFQYTDEEKQLQTDGNGEVILEDTFYLTAAGGDSWTLEAKDEQDNTVTSPALETRKLIWITELKMPGLSVASSISTFKSQFTSSGYTVIDGDEVAMTAIENVGSNATPFLNAARTAYRSSGIRDKEPYTVAVAYTDHLAEKASSVRLRKTGVTVGPSASAVRIPVGKSVAGSFAEKPLWNDLVTGEGWFVSARFVPSAGGGSPRTIAEEALTASGDWAAAPGYLNLIDVDVTGLPAGTGTIELRVDLVDFMAAGLSFNSYNLIVTSAVSWWRPKSTARQNEVLVHEMGHKVGMVPESGDQLTPPAHQYTGHAHVGSHCHKGVTLPSGASTPFPNGTTGTTCVMFGATNGRASFCSECLPLVKKLDSAPGWLQSL